VERDSIAAHKTGRKWSPAALLCCAGCIVTIAAFGSHLLSLSAARTAHLSRDWKAVLFILLGALLLAIVLATAALARRVSGNLPHLQPRKAGTGLWPVFALLVTAHLLFAFLIVRPGSGVAIDVYTFQKAACQNLLKGIDPFGTTQANIFDARGTSRYYAPGLVADGRVQEGFQYPPLTLFWALPGFVLGDVRLSYIFAVIVSAWLLFALSPDNRGLAIVCVLLLSPLTFVVEFCSYTEPLVYMALCATIYAAVKKCWWLPIALGLFLATKQYNLFALPLIAYFVHRSEVKAYWRLVGLSLITAAVTVVPFAFWNLRALWHDMVLFNLMQPYRLDSLSLGVLFPWIMKIDPVLVLAFVVWALWAGNRSAATFPAAYGVGLLLLCFFSTKAFANYYFLAAQAFFLSIAALSAAEDKNVAQGSFAS